MYVCVGGYGHHNLCPYTLWGTDVGLSLFSYIIEIVFVPVQC